VVGKKLAGLGKFNCLYLEFARDRFSTLLDGPYWANTLKG
jgi:hypothetical protein